MYAQGGKKSLNTYTFDLMQEPAAKLTFILNFKSVERIFCFALYSTRREGETFLKNQKSFLIIQHGGCMRPNSDFMVLDACLFYVTFVLSFANSDLS